MLRKCTVHKDNVATVRPKQPVRMCTNPSMRILISLENMIPFYCDTQLCQHSTVVPAPRCLSLPHMHADNTTSCRQNGPVHLCATCLSIICYQHSLKLRCSCYTNTKVRYTPAIGNGIMWVGGATLVPQGMKETATFYIS